jgi:hypothetical protein
MDPNVLFATFLIGILLGIILGAITVYLVAIVELARAGFLRARQSRFVRFFHLAKQ